MKKLGLIGYPLGHSWSREIHQYFTKQKYELFPLEEKDMIDFLKSKDFDGLNVTIPYKETVIPYLDELDDGAKEIGAVNCIVNQNGKLKGYNTDYLGFKQMLVSNHISVNEGLVALLGTGGARKACEKALHDLGANTITVSRSASKGITYDELYTREKEISVIVNTTPVGMKPDYDGLPIDLDKFTNLKAVIDVVANPIMTRLQFEAKMRNITYLGGFEMLVRQALVADKLFFEKEFDDTLVQPCMQEVLKEKRNVVLIGMPTSGKSTIAKVLAEQTGNTLVEMDDELVNEFGTSIKEVFAQKGETYFRDAETELTKKLRDKEKCIISCGGGVIKREENMRNLNHNGIVIWLDRSVDKLYGTSSRPLCKDDDAIGKLYNERKDLYQKYADVRVENNGTLEETVEKVIQLIGGK